MTKKIGLFIAFTGIIILAFSIYQTVKNQGNNMILLQPIGVVLAIGGSLFHIIKNKKS